MQHTDVGDLAQCCLIVTLDVDIMSISSRFIDQYVFLHSYTGLAMWFLYQNTENVVLIEVPKPMVDASDLVLNPI